AAKAVLLREPLKPTRPALDQPSRLPCMSVIVTCVLLNVARMFAMPTEIFLAPLALTIFLPAKSSASNSAAVGAEPATGAAPSAGLAAGASAAPAAAGAFFALVSSAALAGFSAAAPSGLPSFFGAGFFFSSAIKNQL